MKKLSMFLTLAVVGAATSMGCSSSPGSKPEGGTATGWALTPSDTGFLAADANMAGITGAWYSYGDSWGGTPTSMAGGDCTKAGFTAAECSDIVTPVPGQPFMNTGGVMCTNGTVAKVANMPGTTTPAYSAIWGAGVGFDLNNGGTDDGGTGAKQTYDAVAHGVTGFSFHIDMTGPPTGGQMRVEFPTYAMMGVTDINAAYWGGASTDLSPFTKAGDFSFTLAEVGGPHYATSPPAFDPTKILSMQFHVVANTSSTVPFTYCISNVQALHN
jgi:hypothetical protein